MRSGCIAVKSVKFDSQPPANEKCYSLLGSLKTWSSFLCQRPICGLATYYNSNLFHYNCRFDQGLCLSFTISENFTWKLLAKNLRRVFHHKYRPDECCAVSSINLTSLSWLKIVDLHPFPCLNLSSFLEE